MGAASPVMKEGALFLDLVLAAVEVFFDLDSGRMEMASRYSGLLVSDLPTLGSAGTTAFRKVLQLETVITNNKINNGFLCISRILRYRPKFEPWQK